MRKLDSSKRYPERKGGKRTAGLQAILKDVSFKFGLIRYPESITQI